MKLEDYEKVTKKTKKEELPVYEEQGWLKGRKIKYAAE